MFITFLSFITEKNGKHFNGLVSDILNVSWQNTSFSRFN